MPVPASALADRMPEGFRAWTPAEAGLPPDPRGDAQLGIESFTCADGVSYGSLFSFVEPPAALADPDAYYHFVKWDTLVHDDATRATLAAAGLPVHAGESVWDTWEAQGENRAFSGRMAMDGAYAFDGSAPAPFDGPATLSFVEFTPTTNGLARWAVATSNTHASQGAGTVTLPPGWARDIVGSDTTQAFFLVLEANFDTVTVTLPGPLA